MKAKILSTPSEKYTGVIGRDKLDPDEVFVFTGINPYTSFHMHNVKFPIDIAFLDQDCAILAIKTMIPDEGNATAPNGTCYAVEACEGYFKQNNLKEDDFWKEIYNKVQ